MAVSAAQTAANNNATMEGQYAFVQQLVGAVPELAQLVANLSAQGATADAFAAAFESTNWWRTNSDTVKQQVELQASDPAQYQQNLTQAQQHVQAMAAQMGVPLTAAQVSAFATTDLYQGLNDDQLKANIGGALSTTPAAGSTPTGDVATYTSLLQGMASDYGVPVTSTWINGLVQSALSTGQSAQELQSTAQMQLQAQAISSYPSLAQQLTAGQTVKDVAQPYIAAMSNILELPDTNISVTDPTIQRALNNTSLTPGASAPKSTGTAATGNTAGSAPSTSGTTNQAGPTAMTLYDFQNQLRADPRWQQTDNAKASAYSMMASLGKNFGFAS